MTEYRLQLLAIAIASFACQFAHGQGAFVQRIEGTNVSFKMVPVPAGSFLMGSPDNEPGRNADEGPRHPVRIEAFFMEEHEVTWAEYGVFMQTFNRLAAERPVQVPVDKFADSVTFPSPMYDVQAGPLLQRMGGRGPNMPAVAMSQFAARQYSKWLSKKTGRFYRLPSEAEWEYAARAGTQIAYFFGDDPSELGQYAWFKGNSKESDGQPGYHPVMTKKPNPWGLYDMYGNAMEWCVDLYDAEAYTKFGDRSTDGRDPVKWAGETKTPYPRVLRGGGFDSEAAQCRSASRSGSDKRMNDLDPDVPKSLHWMSDAFYVGFRVVAPVKEPAEEEKRKWWDADDLNTLKLIQRDREMKAIISIQGTMQRVER